MTCIWQLHANLPTTRTLACQAIRHNSGRHFKSSLRHVMKSISVELDSPGDVISTKVAFTCISEIVKDTTCMHIMGDARSTEMYLNHDGQSQAIFGDGRLAFLARCTTTFGIFCLERHACMMITHPGM